MATLTRTREEPTRTSSFDNLLASTVPAPFPREQLQEHVEETTPDLTTDTDAQDTTLTDVELIPSIAYVQKSCIMALNNILSVPDNWASIIPDRRHSLPASPASPIYPQETAPLRTLLSNLRNRDNDEMIQFNASADEGELIRELQTRVDAVSYQLSPSDAELSRALVSLLSNAHRISTSQHGLSFSGRSPLQQTSSRSPVDTDVYDTLKRQLSDFQRERQTLPDSTPGTPPVVAVEMALLWSRIDEDLETVLAMCRERKEHLPPKYDIYDSVDDLPEYEQGSIYRYSTDDTKSSTAATASSITNEKMRLDLEAVTLAIDRLYQVAPQLHNQRVELNSSKLRQMERARSSSSAAILTKGKGKEKADLAELDNILGLISKASERKMTDQTVVLGDMESRLHKAQLRDQAQREAFVERLAAHSTAGRLHGQDAILQPARMKNPEDMLTLPEFIRESVPTAILQGQASSNRSSTTTPSTKSSTLRKSRSFRKQLGRNRSLSAPSFPWLKQSLSRASALSAEAKAASPLRSPPLIDSSNEDTLNVHYVAEYHENLQHVLAFVSIPGLAPEESIEAEVPLLAQGGTEGDTLIIRAGSRSSLPLLLPARTSAGSKPVMAQSGHYEIKLFTSPSASGSSPPSAPLMDATQLLSLEPSSFSCASCSLPLVRGVDVGKYRDLPSEHWEELVDAWMCHADQKLHDTVAKHGRGFWPEPGQALVGGSYILFAHSNVVQNNVRLADENKRGEEWVLVRCICGATIGRSQARVVETTYRLLKFAIRPINARQQPIKIPLSAYIMEDMTEFVQAHATYRFVILDEEQEKLRMLIWLFKPSIRLSYSAPTSYAIAKTANVHAGKVLFKIFKPDSLEQNDLKSVISKYPGFPQAEYLYYPLATCRRIAGLLKESNGAYPQSLRTMTGLDVGWLCRA